MFKRCNPVHNRRNTLLCNPIFPTATKHEIIESNESGCKTEKAKHNDIASTTTEQQRCRADVFLG
jgi:hypothetical protein